MSFCAQMAAAIDGARTLTRLDHLSRSIWQGLAAGAVADDDAQALAELLHARRGVLRGEIKPVGIPAGRPSIFSPRRLQRSPQRSVAIARRRHLAASGPMPPALACKRIARARHDYVAKTVGEMNRRLADQKHEALKVLGVQ